MTPVAPERPTTPLPDELLALDEEYTNVLGLLDREVVTS
jgi:hypothetical protein